MNTGHDNNPHRRRPRRLCADAHSSAPSQNSKIPDSTLNQTSTNPFLIFRCISKSLGVDPASTLTEIQSQTLSPILRAMMNPPLMEHGSGVSFESIPAYWIDSLRQAKHISLIPPIRALVEFCDSPKYCDRTPMSPSTSAPLSNHIVERIHFKQDLPEQHVVEYLVNRGRVEDLLISSGVISKRPYATRQTHSYFEGDIFDIGVLKHGDKIQISDLRGFSIQLETSQMPSEPSETVFSFSLKAITPNTPLSLRSIDGGTPLFLAVLSRAIPSQSDTPMSFASGNETIQYVRLSAASPGNRGTPQELFDRLRVNGEIALAILKQSDEHPESGHFDLMELLAPSSIQITPVSRLEHLLALALDQRASAANKRILAALPTSGIELTQALLANSTRGSQGLSVLTKLATFPATFVIKKGKVSSVAIEYEPASFLRIMKDGRGEVMCLISSDANGHHLESPPMLFTKEEWTATLELVADTIENKINLPQMT